MDDHSWQTSSQWIMMGLLLLFAIAHSGLASLRPWAEKRVGARLYRIFFALVSLPLATLLILYFLAHRYDGVQLWQLQGVPGMRALVGSLSAVSFLFLYPATFNLLEIAAVQKPEIHLYETGIIRITRHPQLWGQVLWCVAHTLWLGTSFTLLTSLGLIAHHCFGVWHGDRRWYARHGAAFTALKARTSILPFKAIWEGKQQLVWQEFCRPAYSGVAVFVALLWWLHPYFYRITPQILPF